APRAFADLAMLRAGGALPPRRIGSRKQPAAAVATHPQAAVAEDACRFRDAGLLHHVAPRCDPGEAVTRGSRHRLGQLPLLAHGREIEGDVGSRHGEPQRAPCGFSCSACAAMRTEALTAPKPT